MDTCFVCSNKLKGPSAKKDFPVCQTCFDLLYKQERETIRKLDNFKPADHIIDNIYLGGELSAINLEYLQQNNIDRILMAAEFVDSHFSDPKHGIEYLHLKIDDSP